MRGLCDADVGYLVSQLNGSCFYDRVRLRYLRLCRRLTDSTTGKGINTSFTNMNELIHCSIDHLQAYLEGTLDESMHGPLLAHLDQCERCRQQIEGCAGSAEDWMAARNALAECKLDEEGNLIDENTLVETLQNHRSTDSVSLLQMLAPSDDPRAAGRIGPFEITGIVGSGGMGIVLKARDPALDRFVAVKMLAPHLAKSQSARKRFAREARAAAAVIHDNVIAIYQVAEWNELPYLVMPYMPDPSLQQRIDDQGRLDLESTLSIGMQVARGLAAAHTQGLVHRDVKPANVLLAKGTERAVITDFGLARAADDASLTRIGLLAGTPHYMSPEQARGEAVDQKSDLFSLGSLLFAMFTGQPPIANELGSETIRRISTGKVPSLSSQAIVAPQWFIKLVDRLHRPDPADRPESAAQVALWLEQCLAHQRQPEAQPVPACLLPVRKANRKRGVLAIVAIVGVSLLVALPPMLTKKEMAEKETAEKRPAENAAPVSNGNPSLLGEPLQMDAPKSIDWLGERANVAELLNRATELQTSIEQVWGIMPEPTTNETNTVSPFIQSPDDE